MALVTVIIPLVVKLFCSKKELMINMKERETLSFEDGNQESACTENHFPDSSDYGCRSLCTDGSAFDWYVDVW